MGRISFRKECPRCKTDSMKRVARKEWMRHLPSTKYYKCNRCRSRVLIFSDWLAVRLK